jgi:hypothetical protein
VEDRLPDLVGRVALRLRLLVGEQHDDLAVCREHVLELRDDIAGGRTRGAGGGDGGGCRGGGARLGAAALKRQAGKGHEGRQGGEQASAHRQGVRSSDQPRRPGWNRRR